MSTTDAALAVTVLDAIVALAEGELTKKRAEAEAVFKDAINSTSFRASTGALQVDITLPDGQVIGRLSVKAGTKTTTTDEVGLHEWAAERNREALEEYAVPAAARDERVLDLLMRECPEALGVHVKPEMLGDPRVLDLLRGKFPELVSSRVRPGSLKAYVAEARKSGENAPKGWLFDPETGERLHLVTETQQDPSGAFAFNGAETADRRRAVIEALAAGDPVVRAIAFGAVGAIALVAEEAETIPGEVASDWLAAETGAETPPMAEKTPFGAPFCDEHGFKSPEMAAAHAVMVQGGYSTPPIEAYRMLRDGGVGAERARAWMDLHGLNPDDPHQGENVSWPLSAANEPAGYGQ